MIDEPLIPKATFRLLRETADLRVAEAIRTVLQREGIGAVIVGDEAVQNLPPNERVEKSQSLRTRFRVEVPAELHENASKILKQLETPDE